MWRFLASHQERGANLAKELAAQYSTAGLVYVHTQKNVSAVFPVATKNKTKGKFNHRVTERIFAKDELCCDVAAQE